MLNLGITEYLKYQKLAITFGVFHLLVLLFLLSIDIDLIKRPFGMMWIFSIEVAAIAFGLMQMLTHKRTGHWIYLLHRPLSVPRILSSLIAAGCFLLLIALVIPYLILLMYMDNIGIYGVELRHYTGLSISAMAAVSIYLIACFVILSPHRLSFVTLVFFILFVTNFTNIRIYPASLLVLCSALLIVFVAFKPDLNAPSKHFTEILITEVPIQSALYLILLGVLSTVLEFNPNNPLSNPVDYSAYSIARKSSDEIMMSALEGASHSESEFIRQQIEIGEFIDVLGPASLSYPVRNQRATQDSKLVLRDDDNGAIWLFSHSMMLFEGVDTELKERVGWLGPGGFYGVDSMPERRFSSVPWVTANQFVINASSMFQLDWDSRRFVKRFEMSAEGELDRLESFSDSFNLTENATTLVSNKHLYIFRTEDVRDIDAQLRLRTKLSLTTDGEEPVNRRPYGKLIYVMELIDGYLVSIISNIPPRFSSLIDFSLYGQAELSLYKTNESLVNELINTRDLEDTFSYGYVYQGFIGSPGIWQITNFFDALYFADPARKFSSSYSDIRLSALLITGLANMAFVLVMFSLLRKTRLSKTARVSWLLLTAFTGLVGLISFFLGIYWRKLKVEQPSINEPVFNPNSA